MKRMPVWLVNIVNMKSKCFAEIFLSDMFCLFDVFFFVIAVVIISANLLLIVGGAISSVRLYWNNPDRCELWMA